MGKHNKLRQHRHQVLLPMGMVEIVDIRTGHNHLVTLDAAAAAWQAAGRYRALCGTEILPAALVDPGTGYCWPCQVYHHLRPTRREVMCPPTWHIPGFSQASVSRPGR